MSADFIYFYGWDRESTLAEERYVHARARDEHFVTEAIAVLATAEAYLFHSVTRDTT